MAGFTKKNIFIVVVSIAILITSVGFYFYNKGPVNITNSPAQKTDAVALYNKYADDSATAQKKYTAKIILVNGTVSKITTNLQGEMIVLLKTSFKEAFINCSFEQNSIIPAANKPVQIKGFCSGLGQGDEELGIKADVYLTRCIIIK